MMKYQQQPIVLLMQIQPEEARSSRPDFLSAQSLARDFSIREFHLTIWYDPKWANEARFLQKATESAESVVRAMGEKADATIPLLAVINEIHLGDLEQREAKTPSPPKGKLGHLWKKQWKEAPSLGYYYTANANGTAVCTYHPTSQTIGSYPYHWVVIGQPDPDTWARLQEWDWLADYSAMMKAANSRLLKFALWLFTRLMTRVFETQKYEETKSEGEEGPVYE